MQTETDSDHLLELGHAARIVGVSVGWMRVLCDRGALPCVRTASGRRLVRRGDVERFAHERRSQLHEQAARA